MRASQKRPPHAIRGEATVKEPVSPPFGAKADVSRIVVDLVKMHDRELKQKCRQALDDAEIATAPFPPPPWPAVFNRTAVRLATARSASNDR
jgi:hypothetical protein